MIARHVNLGRVVIVIGGLLVFAALASHMFAAGENPWKWIGLLAGMITGFLALILLGRTLGGWLADRLGKDREHWRREGIRWSVLLPTFGLMLYRWLGVG